MVVYLLVAFVVILFLFTDIWYFIRVGYIFLSSLFHGDSLLNEDDLYRTYRISGVVLPSDLDFNLHMNNSRYTRECDFARMAVWFRSGMFKVVFKLNAKVVVSAITIRYRRSLTLFQSYHVTARLLCWDDDALYFEQSLVMADGFIAAIVLVKMAVRGTTPTDLVTAMFKGKRQVSRQPSLELVKWKESIALSSMKLRPQQST